MLPAPTYDKFDAAKMEILGMLFTASQQPTSGWHHRMKVQSFDKRIQDIIEALRPKPQENGNGTHRPGTNGSVPAARQV